MTLKTPCIVNGKVIFKPDDDIYKVLQKMGDMLYFLNLTLSQIHQDLLDQDLLKRDWYEMMQTEVKEGIKSEGRPD